MMSIEQYLKPKTWLKKGRGPRYQLLKSRLEDAMSDGTLAAGTSLPPERQIAEITGLSRVTVRRAMAELVRDGSVDPRQGSGSYVRGAAEMMPETIGRLASFTDEMAQRGLKAGTTLVDAEIATPSTEETVALGLSPEAQVTRMTRVRTVNGQPMAMEQTALPSDVLPKPKQARKSLYATLDAAGMRPARAVERVAPIALGKREAKLLGLPKGTPAIAFERTSYLASGRPVEFTRAIKCGDAAEMLVEHRSIPSA
jgi:GntR family transcriptional regulator